MTYLINEVFYSIQGEGYWTGRPAVFVRFSRCNLWTGREEDRATAVCKFCDTNFLEATRYTLKELFSAVLDAAKDRCRFVVLTGGEPTLQVDDELVSAFKERGYYIAIETNGTRPLPTGLDWVCVSPKAGTLLHPQCTTGNELKVVWPQRFDMDWLSCLKFEHFWVSPMDGTNLKANTDAALKYVLTHQQWRLNIQTHKAIGAR